ncbi:S-adenosyl-L-methionine-dependent methyltransferase [Hypoxylon sp. NC0597]|nr:S-adenosyl-L-methionine-dependent methyltransferase [Hypoxylon sp. NC0597]
MSALNRLSTALKDLDSESFENEDDRVHVESLLLEALTRVRAPWDIAWNHNWVNLATNGAIKTLIDAGIFTKWTEHGSRPQTSIELAKLTETDPALIRRLMRHLSAQHLLIETAEDTYEPTSWATTLGTDPAFPALYGSFYHDVATVVFGGMPSFLKKTGYKNPTDATNGVIQHLQGSGTSFFQYIVSDSIRNKEFADAMGSYSKRNTTAWLDVFPTDTLLQDAKLDRPLVVDVGGSKGHDLEEFRLRHPEIPDGSLVLQDLPGVLRSVQITDKSVTKDPYDFFAPQPIMGARAYLLHKVLYDWQDEQAIAILKNIADAMEKGYSKLLIYESMIDNIKLSPRTTTSDLTTLACVTAAERTVKEWNDLVAAAGLKVVKNWKLLTAIDGVIEAELI